MKRLRQLQSVAFCVASVLIILSASRAASIPLELGDLIHMGQRGRPYNRAYRD